MRHHGFEHARFNATCGAIYHGEMATFNDCLEKSLNIFIIVLGSSAASGVINHLYVPREFVDFVIVVLATMQIAFRYAKRTQRHKAVAHACGELLSEIEGCRKPSDSDISNWNKKLVLLRLEDGMQMRAMAAIAYNEALEACVEDVATRQAHRKHVRVWHRVLRHVHPFKGTNFDPRK